MNNHTKQCLTFAHQNAAHYATMPNVKAILLAGSVSQHRADNHSDIDMMIYYDPFLTAEQFAAEKETALTKMVEKHLRFTPRWVLEKMGADRDERLFLAEELLNNQKNLLGVFYGLNKLYHPGKVKGVAWAISKMISNPMIYTAVYSKSTPLTPKRPFPNSAPSLKKLSH